jgi:hypothetical protein
MEFEAFMKKQKIKAFFKKLSSPIRHVFDSQKKPLLHTIEWVFILVAFFTIGFLVIYYERFKLSFIQPAMFPSGSKEALIQTPEEQALFTGEVVPEMDLVDTTDWDTYQNKWYGFEIQHPDSWKNNTQYKTATEKSAVYDTIYKFRKDDEDVNGAYEGFDVRIYSVKKVQNLENTNDVRKKDDAPEDTSGCQLSEEMNFGSEDSYFQKVSVKEGDPCYEPAYFYSITKGGYIYNIVPAIGESGERFSDPEKETTRLFPEHKEAVSSFKFIPIVRPQAKARPRITARKPVSAKVVNGKLVCAKKNDKPGKSKNGNKPGHLDLECCLDPDETPNPWCTY